MIGVNHIKKIIDLLLILMVIMPFTQYTLISYLIFFLLTIVFLIYLFSQNEFKVNKKMIGIVFFMISLFVITLLLEFFQIDRDFSNSMNDTIKRIIVIMVIIVIISNLRLSMLIQFYNHLIRNLFAVGVVLLTISLITNVYLINENAISFFILPYSGYFMYKQKSFILKILSFLLLTVILYLTAGRTALLAFIMTPILIILIKFKALKIIFFVSISLGGTILQFIFISKLEVINQLLSGRIAIQEAYINEIVDNFFVLIFGSGKFILGEEVFYGLGPHQTWIGTIWTFGIVGMLLNLFLIIYLLRFNVKKEYLYLHLISIYIFIMQLFESINIGGISYLSLLLLVSLLIPLKKESIDNDFLEV